jgi:hypothetical protein|tara:strand:- start:446 stop:661 length:216 start_codon:yes stop_codon:yes gene_type:complete
MNSLEEQRTLNEVDEEGNEICDCTDCACGTIAQCSESPPPGEKNACQCCCELWVPDDGPDESEPTETEEEN